jgi:hypothetical protein
MNTMKKIALLSTAFSLLLLSSCEKLLDFEPENQTLASEALQNEDDLQQFLNSAYDVLGVYQNGKSQYYGELLADNLVDPGDNNNDLNEVWSRSTLFFNGTIGGYYKDLYISVFRANSLLENMGQVEGVSEAEQTRMEAEARFIRALGVFTAVRLFAQPYGYTSDNSHPGVVAPTEVVRDPTARNTVQECYDQIIEDLEYAETNLPADNGNYADQMAAKALLAKVYFQMNDFANASAKSAEVINSGKYDLTDDPDRYTFERAAETIFGLVSTGGQDNQAEEFYNKYRTDQPTVPLFQLTQEAFDAGASDTTDLRSAWFEVGQPGTTDEYLGLAKFNANVFYVPLLHLTEMHLIHAECSAELGDIAAGTADLNALRDRAFGVGANPVPANLPKNILLDVIRDERRIELMGEGERVHYLKRRGANGENIEIRGVPWNCDGLILQFPISENSDVFDMNPTSGC